VVTPTKRRQVVTHLTAAFAVSERRACRATGFTRSSQRYASRRPPRDELRERLHTLALLKPRWGYRRLYWLPRREGRPENRKLVQRLYREEGLAVRKRPRKRVSTPRGPRVAPARPNARWSMDFVRDTLGDGRAFRAFTLVDDFTRECLAVEVDTLLPGARVVQVLERLAAARGLPRGIVCDNGPEFAGQVLDQWAHRRGVALPFIDPGRRAGGYAAGGRALRTGTAARTGAHPHARRAIPARLSELARCSAPSGCLATRLGELSAGRIMPAQSSGHDTVPAEPPRLPLGHLGCPPAT
jgi:putative transposase